MEGINPMHRFRMTYGSRRIYAEDVRVAPLALRPVHNPQKPYPYFLEKLRRSQIPLTTLSVKNPRFIPDTPIYVSNEAFNSATWWKDHMRNPSRAWVSETEKPYRDWPYDRLQQGILV